MALPIVIFVLICSCSEDPVSDENENDDPRCDVRPSNLNFGVVHVGESGFASFSVQNTGGGILSGKVESPCPEFHVSRDDEYDLAAGQTASITVRFSPASEGEKNCTITTVPLDCENVVCEGTAVVPCLVTPSVIDFGSVGLGSNFVSKTVAISNVGTLPFQVTIPERCGEYSVSPPGERTISPGQGIFVSVGLLPDNCGRFDCAIPLAPICPDVTVTADVGGAYCYTDKSFLDFGDVRVGSTKDLSFNFSNTGCEIISGVIQLDPQFCPDAADFRIVSGGGAYSFDPGQTLTVTVRFQPTGTGFKDCEISVGDVFPCQFGSFVSCYGVGLE